MNSLTPMTVTLTLLVWDRNATQWTVCFQVFILSGKGPRDRCRRYWLCHMPHGLNYDILGMMFKSLIDNYDEPLPLGSITVHQLLFLRPGTCELICSALQF
jgi:hypothetical protein